ncbi:MAG: hypothetical protein MI919_43535 [Holophagales bacterium]|nr:hypothetical protein [Holophagales bacterium]
MAKAAGSMRIPHAFPFRLVEDPSHLRERRERGGPAAGDTGAVPCVRVRLTQGASLVRGRPFYPPILTLEILAQAALVLAGAAPEPGADAGPTASRADLRLAGFDSVSFAEALVDRPLMAGDELAARVDTVGRFGAVAKVRGELERDGVTVVRAEMLLAGAG